ncbi:MAG: hypothetical protein M3014_00065 [Chloroflexota bacterium]|nr:hypothetical protein [Chloroflexota bacterium]
MNEEDNILRETLSDIAEAETITVFFPLLRRAIVIDTRHNEANAQMVKVMPQANSMDQRIRAIEQVRPELGKVRSIVGIPWMKSVRQLDEQGITPQLVRRLVVTGMDERLARKSVGAALRELWQLENLAFARMIRGHGFKTLWSTRR